MTSDQFLKLLQDHAASFAKAVATNEGEWIIKGFIDVYQRVYSISVDTKIVSKLLELLLFPMFVEFAKTHGLQIELCQHQNFYPDLTFTHTASGNRFAVDIKSTYRESETKVNGMTLGAFTGYFRNPDSNKNTLYPYSHTPRTSSWESSTPSATTLQMRGTSSPLPISPRFRLLSKISSSSPSRNSGLRQPGLEVETRRTSGQPITSPH